MMPEFARGWEKDGWERNYEPTRRWVKSVQLHLTGDWVTFCVTDSGWLFLGTHEEDEIGLPYGDPQVAKKRAETLMEGL